MADVWSVGSQDAAQPRQPGNYHPLARLLEHAYDSDHDEDALSSAVPRFVQRPSTVEQLQHWLDAPSETVTSPDGFYVEPAELIAARTISTLYGVASDYARDLAASVHAVHVRGGAGDAATKFPCPNHELGGIAMSISAAKLGASYISEDVIRDAEPIHKALMEHNSSACWSFDCERVRGFIEAVAGPEHVETASAIFETMKQAWSEVEREMFQWLLKREPRPQVAKMLLSQFAGEQMIALLGRFASLWSPAVIRKKASKAELDYGRDAKSHWRGDVEIVCGGDFNALVSRAKVHVNGWGPLDVQRELEKARRFEETQARIAEIDKPQVILSRYVRRTDGDRISGGPPNRGAPAAPRPRPRKARRGLYVSSPCIDAFLALSAMQ